MKDLRHNFSYQFLSVLTSLLFPLVTFPYITSTLGPSMIGKVNYVDFLSNLIISLTCLGIPLYGTREISKARHDPALRQQLFRDLLRIQFITALLGLLVFTAMLFSHPRFADEKWLLALGLLYIISNVLSADWYLQGMEAFKFIALRNIILRSIGLAAIFLLIHDPGDYVLYYAIIAATQLVTLLFNYAWIKPSLRFKFRKGAKAEHLPLLFYFFIASTFISIYDYTDTVMLGWLSFDANVGFYTTAMKLVKMALLLLLTINTIIFPRLSYFSIEQPGEAATLLRRSIGFVITAAIPAMALFILLAPEMITVFAGNAFEPSINVMRWLSPLPLVIALSNMFLLYYLSKFRRTRMILLLVTSALLISLSLNYLLIPVWNQQGAAIASLSTETFIMIFFGAWLKVPLPLKPLWQSVTGALLFVPVTQLIRQMHWDTLTTLVIALAACGLVYVLFQWMVKNETLLSVKKFLGV